jgi:PIN domain nuclease of toxin-antitoxin system
MNPYRMSLGWARNETSARHSHFHLGADQPEKISTAVLSALEDEANELFLSLASVWENFCVIPSGRLSNTSGQFITN